MKTQSGHIDMTRFACAPDLTFSGNPQVAECTTGVFDTATGDHIGVVLTVDTQARGRRYRVYDLQGRCHADCGQLRDAFTVLCGFR
jgi:hypothetical protein